MAGSPATLASRTDGVAAGVNTLAEHQRAGHASSPRTRSALVGQAGQLGYAAAAAMLSPSGGALAANQGQRGLAAFGHLPQTGVDRERNAELAGVGAELGAAASGSTPGPVGLGIGVGKVASKLGTRLYPDHEMQAALGNNDGAIDQDTANCSAATKFMVLKLKGLARPTVSVGDLLNATYEGGRSPDMEDPNVSAYGQFCYRRFGPMEGERHRSLPSFKWRSALGHWRLGSFTTVKDGFRYGRKEVSEGRWVEYRANEDDEWERDGFLAAEFSTFKFNPKFRKGTGLSKEVMRSVFGASANKDLNTLLKAASDARLTTPLYDETTEYRIERVEEPIAGKPYLALVGGGHWQALVSRGKTGDGQANAVYDHDPLQTEVSRGFHEGNGYRYYEIVP